MNQRIRALAIVALAGATLFAACGDGATEPSAPTPDLPKTTTVTVSPDSATLMALGDTVPLAVEVLHQNGNEVAQAALVWSSSDASVASVDASGLVTAVGNGAATITVASGEASGTATLTVEQTAATVTVSPDSATLTALGDTMPLTAEVRDKNDNVMAEAVLVWSSSGTSVTSVNASGLVKAVGKGTATITVASGEASGTATLTVKQDVSTVTVTPDSATLTALGESMPLTAEVRDRNSQSMGGTTVTWSSNDTLVASVDASGLVTAVGYGSATITVSSGETSGTATLTVKQTAATVTVTPDSAAATALGDTVPLAAEVRDQNNNVMETAVLVWSSSDTSVASVDASGLVTAVGIGTATISASSVDASGTATLTVEQIAVTVTVTPDSTAVTALGDAVPLAVDVLDRNGQTMAGATLTWASSNTSVASVDASGLVTAVGSGEATITAFSGEASGTATLTVEQVAATVAVTPNSAVVTALGDTATLAAEVLDRNGQAMAGATVSWASSNTSVASVDASGLVTAVGNGAVKITADFGEASGTATLTVEQTAATVTVTPEPATLTALGDTARLTAEVLDQNDNEMAEAVLDWSSSDTSVATVDASGLVTAVGNGATTITAASGKVGATADLDVAQEITSLVVKPARLTSAQAGKQGADTIVVTALDSGGSSVSGASYHWATDRHSGWVYPPQGTTDKLGRFHTTWVAGWPGDGSLSLIVENEFSRVTQELATVSTTPENNPSGSASMWISTGSNRNRGYSIDMTPLAEPRGTYYAAIQWDGGYTGLQRGGSRYDRQLQFSVWDAPGHGDAELIEKASDVLCKTFGGEGTGVACALEYPWTVGETYRFEITEEEVNGGKCDNSLRYRSRGR